MRILVTADVHLDHGHWGQTNPTTRRNDAWDSVRSCWQHLVDTSIEQELDAFVVPGDLFLNGRPSAEASELVAEGLRQLSAAGIPVIIAEGNHEHIGVRAGHRTPVQRFADINGVTVVTRPELVHLDTGTLVVMPWPRRSEVLAGQDFDDAREADGLVAAWVVDQIDRLGEAAAKSEGACVFAGHATVGEASIGTDRRGSELLVHAVFSEPVIPVGVLEDGPWSQAVLGHIHRRQWVGDKTHYVGSPDRVDFTEAGELKAASLIDTSLTGRDQVTEILTPARLLADVNLNHPEQLTELEPGTIVRLTAAPDTDRAEITKVRSALASMDCRVARVVIDKAKMRRSKKTAVAEDVTVLDGLSRWLDTQDIGGDHRERLLAAATELVEQADTTAAHSTAA